MLETLRSLVSSLGLAGVFVISALGNAVPYSSVPYLAFIAAYSMAMEAGSRILLVLVGALGATAGKLLIYAASRYAAEKVISEERKKDMEYLRRALSRRYLGLLAVLLFAATPLPDDVLYVPLGVAKYDPTHFFAGTLLGKTVIVGIAVFLGERATWVLSAASEYGTGALIAGAAVLIAFTSVLLAVVIFADWRSVFMALSERGALASLAVLTRETALILTLRHPSIRRRGEKLGELIGKSHDMGEAR